MALKIFILPRLQPAPLDQGDDCGLTTSHFSSLRLFPLIWVKVDVRTLRAFSILLLSLASVSAQDPANPFRVEIDLQQQTASLIRGRGLVLESPISRFRYGHFTQTGSFKVLEKEVNHYSSIYGKIVDANGKTVVTDADVDMKIPRGGKFIPAPMRYFMRFHEADGMHAGYSPVIRRRMGVSGCRSNWPLRSSVQSMSERRSQFSGERLNKRILPIWAGTERRMQPWFGRPVDPRFRPQYDPRYLDPWRR